jgi:hypothetical protein
MIKSRRMRWPGHATHTEEMENAYRILLIKPQDEKPLRRPRCRWEDNIKIS